MNSFVFPKSIIDKFYFWVFKNHPSQTTWEFINDFSWSFLGGGFVGFIALLTNIFIGRFFGPTEYGIINLILSSAQIWMLFFVFGMDRASIRFIAMQKELKNKKILISMIFYFFIFISSVLGLLFILFSTTFQTLLKISHLFLLFSFLIGFILSLRQITNGFIRGLGLFKFQSITRLVESFSFLSLILLFSYYHSQTYSSYFLIFFCVNLFFSGLYLFHIKSSFTVHTSFPLFKSFLSFSSLYFIASIFGVIFGSLDKIVIGTYMGLDDLGLYGAYYMASFTFVSQFTTLVNNVLLPHLSSRLDHLPSLIRKIDRLTLLGFLPLSLVTFLIVFIILHLFGPQYEQNFLYMILFSLMGVMNIVFSINALLAQVHSSRPFLRAFYVGNIAHLFFIGIYFFLIYTGGLSIARVASLLIFYYFVSTLICKYSLYKEGLYSHVYK